MTRMDLQSAQYIEIGLVGLILLLVLLFSIKRSSMEGGMSAQRTFVAMLLCNIVLLISDNAVFALRGNPDPAIITLTHFLLVIYFSLHGAFGYLWTWYCIRRMYPYQPVSRLSCVLLMIPAAINTVLAAVSPWTGGIYQLNESNVYSRGPLIYAVSFLACLYGAVSAVLVIREMVKPSQLREKGVYLSLLLFPLPTIFGNLLQICFYGLSVVWVCSAVSMVILFVSQQNSLVFRDELTCLDNRRRMDRLLEWELQRQKKDDAPLYAIMLDVDHFKHINDEFGHVQGDCALIAVARVLKRSTSGKCFVGRFGGDEFLMLGRGHEQAAMEIMELIRKGVAEVNECAKYPYQISVSMGLAAFPAGSIFTVDQLIGCADRNMYNEKAEKNHIVK